MINENAKVTVYDFPKGQMVLSFGNITLENENKLAAMFYHSNKAFPVGAIVSDEEIESANITPKLCIVIDAERAEVLSRFFRNCASMLKEIEENED